MAANRNKPADFCPTRSKCKRQPVSSQLIPPSAFEKPLESRRTELDEARQQIQDLKSENEYLRQAQNNQSLAPAVRSHSDYAEELIQRQAGEISKLRAEFETCRQKAEYDRSEWERKLKAMEDSHSEERRRLDKLTQFKDEEYEERLMRLNKEHEEKISKAQEDAENLQRGLEDVTLSFQTQTAQLEKELINVSRDAESTKEQLQNQLSEKIKIVDEQARQLSQLRAYVGNYEGTQQSSQGLRLEKETLESKLKVCQAQLQQLRSELELTQVRHTALNDILLVQEAQLSKRCGIPTDALNRKDHHKLLITRWREKVFELLVQQKAAEITFRGEENLANQMISDLEEKVSSGLAKEKMLTHSLTEKEAQWKLEINRREQVEQELALSKQMALTLDSQRQEQEQVLEELKEFSVRHEAKNEEMMQALTEKTSKLKVLSQRISFAAGRMDLLKSQIVRHSAVTFDPANTSNSKPNDSRKSISVSRVDDDMSRDSEEHLYQELERVMRERDMLATQVQQDSEKWTQRLSQSHNHYSTQLDKMKQTVEDLEFDVQQKSKTCAHLSQQLTELKESLEEKDDTIAQLQAELAKHAKGVSAVLTEQRLADEAIWGEKLATLERKLNESKREHAKTVVSLRQMERSHAREMERSAGLLHTTEEHFGRQITRLQTRLEASERDRTVMVATLRQEGLLSQTRGERGEPLRLPLEEDALDEEEEDEEELTKATKPDHEEHGLEVQPLSISQSGRIDGATSQSTDDKSSERDRLSRGGIQPPETSHNAEPVEQVLQDLQALTMAIFDDSEEEEDHDIEEDSRLEEASSDVPSAQVTSDRSDS